MGLNREFFFIDDLLICFFFHVRTIYIQREVDSGPCRGYDMRYDMIWGLFTKHKRENDQSRTVK